MARSLNKVMIIGNIQPSDPELRHTQTGMPICSFKVVTDESKPEGVSSRFCDPSRMNRLYTPKVSLHEGLVRVMDSIRGQQPGGSA